MKKIITVVLAMTLSVVSFSQDKIVSKIKETVTKQDVEAHLTFLASDEMRGRDTGSPEVAIAANYLVAQFKTIGLKAVPGAPDYFQDVKLQRSQPARAVDLKLASQVFHFREDVLLIRGKSISQEAEVVFVGYGQADDLNAVDVKGKIVASYAGSSESSNLRQAFRDSRQKNKLVKEKGGIALIEIVKQKEAPWSMISGFLSGVRFTLAGDEESSAVSEIPLIWMRNSDNEILAKLISQKTMKGSLVIDAPGPMPVSGKNIAGVIEGTDPKLKQEYIVLSAHYDHVGVKKNESQDSIYNGARDNALGTTSILEAARFLIRNPVKRSIIILALCGEEKGLLGSRWYSEHPMIPLEQTVFNFDCDGAGYNDKTIANVIDLNRTTADALIKKGCEAFGLGLKGDPAPDQNLYERSDNYNFAVKGVPAVDFSPGVSGFDQELLKYYHQPPDEVASLDLDYVEKLVRSYVYAAYLIGEAPTRPVWMKGDKFEEAGKKLYH